MTSHGEARRALAAAFAAAEEPASPTMLQAAQAIWWLDGYPGTTPELGAVSLIASLYAHPSIWDALSTGSADTLAGQLAVTGMASSQMQGGRYTYAIELDQAAGQVAAALGEPKLLALSAAGAPPAGPVDPHATASGQAVVAGLAISAVVTWLLYRAVKGVRRG